MVYQLIYISTSRAGDGQIADILKVSKRNNRRDQITGLLLHDGVRFLQALEGHKALVMATFNRISLDGRHRSLVKLSEKEVSCREFGNWEMADQKVDVINDTLTLSEAVNALVAEVPDPNTKALFSSFAALRGDASSSTRR